MKRGDGYLTVLVSRGAARWSLPFGACLFLACGADDAGSSTAVEVRSALVTGAGNVSDGIVPDSIAQSETAAVGIGSALGVAYNAFADPIPGERCYGDSEVGMSYFSGRGWKGIHFYPNYAAAIFTGEPSIAAYDPGGSSYTFWVSTKAIGNLWDSLPKTPDSCVSTATLSNTAPDSICVIAISVPKSGAAATVSNIICHGGMPGLTGATALTVSNGSPYVAGYAQPPGSAGLFFFQADSGAQASRAQPPSNVLPADSPIFAKNTSLDMFFPDALGTMWETIYHPSTDSWSALSSVGPPVLSNLSYNEVNPLPFYAKAGAGEYAAAYLPGSAGPGSVYLFYRDFNYQLIGWARSTSSPGWTHVFTSAAGLQAFHPATTVAAIPNQYPPYTGYHMALTYWDNGGSGGAMNLKYTDNVGVSAPVTLASEVPCPHLYLGSPTWGYYDEMATLNDNTAGPQFYRFFTDSTKSACLTDTADWTTNTPQHVSIIRAPL